MLGESPLEFVGLLELVRIAALVDAPNPEKKPFMKDLVVEKARDRWMAMDCLRLKGCVLLFLFWGVTAMGRNG